MARDEQDAEAGEAALQTTPVARPGKAARWGKTRRGATKGTEAATTTEGDAHACPCRCWSGRRQKSSRLQRRLPTRRRDADVGGFCGGPSANSPFPAHTTPPPPHLPPSVIPHRICRFSENVASPLRRQAPRMVARVTDDSEATLTSHEHVAIGPRPQRVASLQSTWRPP